MNGQACRAGYGNQSDLCPSTTKHGGSSARESAAAIAMDAGGSEIQTRGGNQ